MPMQIHHHHYYHHSPEARCEVMRRLEAMQEQTGLILVTLENDIMPTMEDLKAAVARNTTVDDSVLALLQGISQQLKDAQAANDPQAITDIIAQLDANTQKMTDAVTANTPSA